MKRKSGNETTQAIGQADAVIPEEDLDDQENPPIPQNLEVGSIAPPQQNNMGSIYDQNTNYVRAVSKVLNTIRDPDDKIRLMKNAKRTLTRKRKAVDVQPINDFSALIKGLKSAGLEENITNELEKAGSYLHLQLQKFFVTRNGKTVYKRPTAEVRIAVNRQPAGRSAARIAKMIRARLALSKLNGRNLSNQLISARSNISQAARIGSASVMIQKYNRGLKLYETDDPNEMAQKAITKTSEGLQKSLSSITNKINTGARLLQAFNNEKYKTYLDVKNKNKLVNDTLTTDDKRVFGQQ